MNYQTKWNLKLLYAGDKDPRIERDIRAIERACALFEKKYKNTTFASTPQALFSAMRAYEKITLLTSEEKPWWYFALKTSMNAQDSDADARATSYIQRIMHALNKIQFFELEIAKIPSGAQKKFLRHPLLKRYAYQLQTIFRSAKYNLSEAEEQLATLLSQPAYQMWKKGQEKKVNTEMIRFKGKDIPLSTASTRLPELKAADRKLLQKAINERLESISFFAESEINAVYTFKKILDEKRGYPTPYSSAAVEHEMEESIIGMVASLVTKYFSISRRFYKLHAKLLKQKKLHYGDRSAKIGDIRRSFSFDQAIDIVRAAFARVDGSYARMLDEFLKKGQIDVFPRKGKHGGAFCWGGGMLPTYVLLNHMDNVLSVETFGHEMGHAIHTELSKQNPPMYVSYSTATAEVASTFFEQVTSAEIEKRLSPKERVLFLHNKLIGDISTVFRQIACFNFELELHTRIRKEGQLTKEKIADLMAKHLQSYIGPAMNVTRQDGYAFVSWPHIRSFFYVYTYAYGQLISKALFEKWKQDPSYAKRIGQFLRAGRSMSPKDIFLSIGIDTSKPEFFTLGLKSIEKDVEKLEQLAKKMKL